MLHLFAAAHLTSLYIKELMSPMSLMPMRLGQMPFTCLFVEIWWLGLVLKICGNSFSARFVAICRPWQTYLPCSASTRTFSSAMMTMWRLRRPKPSKEGLRRFALSSEECAVPLWMLLPSQTSSSEPRLGYLLQPRTHMQPTCSPLAGTDHDGLLARLHSFIIHHHNWT